MKEIKSVSHVTAQAFILAPTVKDQEYALSVTMDGTLVMIAMEMALYLVQIVTDLAIL